MSSLTLNQSLERVGFTLIPFPENLRNRLLDHITDTIGSRLDGERVAGQTDRGLRELICNLPADIFECVAGRQAVRIFPSTTAKEVLEAVKPFLREATGSNVFELLPALTRHASENTNLAGDEYFVYWRLYCPSDREATPAHADVQFNCMHSAKGELRLPSNLRRIWKIWIPIAGCTQSNSLQVLPESHHWRVPFCEVVRSGTKKPSIDAEWLTAHDGGFECPFPKSIYGNAMLFDERLVHRGPANQTQHVRISIDFEVLELHASLDA